jgi:hypothetical protein
MKNKNKIDEGALDVGMQSYQTSSTSSSSSNQKKPTVVVKKQDLQKTMKDLKDTDANVMVTNENDVPTAKPKFAYLSEVQDAKTGEISKPFTIGDKRYQMVRAINPNKEKVMGVYSLDETDDDGDNIIYDVKEFEETIAKKAMAAMAEEEAGDVSALEPNDGNVIDEPADEVNPHSKADEVDGPSFVGFKHYIVNRKTGKARKFKSIEDLAKAQMTEDEQYMGIKDFKKYVDEVLFGASKRQMKEVDTVASTTTATQTTATPLEQKMIASAEKMMKMITEKIPTQVIQQIKTNHIAQREVILAFAELVGVPNNEIQKIIIGLKDMGRDFKPAGVNESKIIKKIKVKDIK